METISQLRAVQFLSAGDAAAHFSHQHIAHGFWGKGRERIAAHELKQVHGTHIVEVRGTPSLAAGSLPEGDGLLTTTKGTVLTIKTADCLPVLGIDRQKRLAFAVHAGWRGLTAGILQQAISSCRAHGIAPAELLIAIGPAISRERYEVGDEVVAALYAPTLGLSPKSAALCLAKGQGARWHVDLPLAAVLSLMGAGVHPENIGVVQSCTFQDLSLNSYRRDGKGFGSNWNWIQL